MKKINILFILLSMILTTTIISCDSSIKLFEYKPATQKREIHDQTESEGIKESANLVGKIINSVNDKQLSDVDVKANNKANNISYTTKTDNEGTFYLDVTEGNYTLEFNHPDYDLPSQEVEIKEGQKTQLINNEIAANPKLESNSLRIVLSWGEQPEDLDLHLLTYQDNPSDYDQHIYYRNEKSRDEEITFDNDCVHSFGPETITVDNIQEQKYIIVVRDYYKKGKFINSNATIKIYNEHGLINTIKVPTTFPDSYSPIFFYNWKVFTYDGKTNEFEIINELCTYLDYMN